MGLLQRRGGCPRLGHPERRARGAASLGALARELARARRVELLVSRDGVDALLRPLLPRLSVALHRAPADFAAVLLLPGRDVPELSELALEELPEGVRLAVAPRAVVQALAEACTLQLAGEIAEELPPGSAWVLLLGPRGAATRAITGPSMKVKGAVS